MALATDRPVMVFVPRSRRFRRTWGSRWCGPLETSSTASGGAIQTSSSRRSYTTGTGPARRASGRSMAVRSSTSSAGTSRRAPRVSRITRSSGSNLPARSCSNDDLSADWLRWTGIRKSRRNAARGRGVRGTAISRSFAATRPGEVGLRSRDDGSEDPDDSADRAGLAAVVDQDDADHYRHDRAVHQVLAGHCRRRPHGSAEDHVDDDGRCNVSILGLRNSLVRPLDAVNRHRQEDRQDAAQYEQQLVGLLRAELGHGFPSRLIAGRHGFSCPPETVSIWVPARLAALRITRQNRGRGGPPESLFRGGKRPRFAPQGHVIGPDLRFRPLGAL